MEAILLISGVAVLVIIHGIIIRTTHRISMAKAIVAAAIGIVLVLLTNMMGLLF